MSCFELFDRTRIQLRSVSTRKSALRVEECLPLTPPPSVYQHAEFAELVETIIAARQHQRPVILFVGAHVIKLGLSRFVIDLVERGFVNHLAMNGGALIHDFELSSLGQTSEDVARWLPAGQFGLWQETSRLNDLIGRADARGEGLAEGVGRILEENQAAYRQLSLVRTAWLQQIPATCHVGIGADIIHGMANCDPAALGRTTYRDFLMFTRTCEDLQGGVYLNVGSAVTGPEVLLKALAMARNVAHQRQQRIDRFTTAVLDLVPLPTSFREGPPDKNHFLYYFRPWKTLLCRAVASAGRSYYFCGDHRATIPSLWQALIEQADSRLRTSHSSPDTMNVR
jgi:hypothetical protein